MLPVTTPIVDKIRNLRKKIYANPLVKSKDPILRIEAIKLLKSPREMKNSQKRTEKAKTSINKKKQRLHRSLEDDLLDDFLENNTITSVPPKDFINCVSPISLNKDSDMIIVETLPLNEVNHDIRSHTQKFHYNFDKTELRKLKAELFDSFSSTLEHKRPKTSLNHRKNISQTPNLLPLSLVGKHVPNRFFVQKACTPDNNFHRRFYSYIEESSNQGFTIDKKHFEMPMKNDDNEKISPWSSSGTKPKIYKFDDLNDKTYGKASKIPKHIELQHMAVSTEAI